MHYKRIRDLRTDHDLRQIDVAEFLGCHEGVYRRYENGSREIPLWALMKLRNGMMSVSIIYWGLQIIEENMGNERLWDKSCTIAFYYFQDCVSILRLS